MNVGRSSFELPILLIAIKSLNIDRFIANGADFTIWRIKMKIVVSSEFTERLTTTSFLCDILTSSLWPGRYYDHSITFHKTCAVALN